jgi:hypothetical protein
MIIPTNAADVFRQTQKRMERQERRVSSASAIDVLGAGFASQAVQIADWNALDVTSNGFYHSLPGAQNSPDVTLSWTGQVIARDNGTGMQQVWNTDGLTSTYWVRSYAADSPAPAAPITRAEVGAVVERTEPSGDRAGAYGSGSLSDESDLTGWFANTFHVVADPTLDEQGFIDIALPESTIAFPTLHLRGQVSTHDTEQLGFEVSVLDGDGFIVHEETVLPTSQSITNFDLDFSDVPEVLDGAHTLVITRGEIIGDIGGSYSVSIYEAWLTGESTAPTGTGAVLVFSEWKRFFTPSGYVGETEIDPPVMGTITDAHTMAQQALADAEEAMGYGQSSNRVFRQGTAPVSDEDYTLRIGDTWFNSADGNRISVWNGTTWVDAQDADLAAAAAAAAQAQTDAAAAVSDAAEAITDAGAAATAAANAQTLAQQGVDDAADAIAAASLASSAASNAHTLAQQGVDDAAQAITDADAAATAAANAQTAASQAISDAEDAMDFAETRSKVYRQTSMPVSGVLGDTWFDTDDGNRIYVHNGTTFTDTRDTGIAAAMTAANGKNVVFRQDNIPPLTGRVTGDTWFETDQSNRVHVWSGGAWTLTSFGVNAITDSAITSAKIADAAVATAKIADGAVLTAKIANTAVDASKLADASVVQAKIADAAVVTSKIATGAVIDTSIAALAVTATKIATGAVLQDKIADAAIVTSKIATGAVLTAQIADSAISTAKIQTGAVLAAQIADAAVITAKIAPAAVVTASINDLAITSPKVADAAIGTAKIDNLAVTSGKIALLAVGSAQIADAAITSLKVADAAIVEAKIGNLAVTNAKIGALAVTTAKIDSLAVTAAKIALLAVGSAQIADAAITSLKVADAAIVEAKIGNLAVTSAKIDNLAVTEAKIANLGVTEAKIGNLAVTSAKIADLAVTSLKVADAAIVEAKIGNLAVTNAKIAALAVTEAKIADLAVTTAKIATLAVGSAQIADLAVSSAKVADAAIVTAKIGDLAVTTAKIDSLAVTNAKIADLTVTGAKIANATITDAKISNLDAAKITTGTLDANRIGANTITTTHLAVQGENLVNDPGFASGTTSAHSVSGNAAWTAAIGTTGPHSGAYTLEYQFSAAVAANATALLTNGAAGSLTVPHPNVSPGETIHWGAWVWMSPGSTVTIRPAILIRSRNNPTVALLTSNGSLTNYAGQGWVYVSHNYTIPPATAETNLYAIGSLVFGAGGGGAGQIVRIDSMVMRRKLAGSLIVDGTIATANLAATAIDGMTVTGATLQTVATAARGVKMTSTGLTAYNASGVATLTINGTDGSIAMLGALTSGSTVTGATVTGGTVQTEATVARGVKITSTGLVAYDAAGAATFTITATTGAVSMLGALTSGSTITGATITATTLTGGTVQTEATAARGIKINSTGLVAYDAAGVATFTALAATGAVSMLGALTSGSTVTGATITGGTVQTESTPARGVKVTSTGLVAYDGAGTPTFTITAATGAVATVGAIIGGGTITGAVFQTSSSAVTGVKIDATGLTGYNASGVATTLLSATTGILTVTGSVIAGGEVNGAIVTGGTIQTESTAARGIKVNSTGLTAYDAAGNPTLTITAATGAVAMLGALTAGSTITGATITGSTFQTATSGERIVLTTAAANELQMHSGDARFSTPAVLVSDAEVDGNPSTWHYARLRSSKAVADVNNFAEVYLATRVQHADDSVQTYLNAQADVVSLYAPEAMDLSTEGSLTLSGDTGIELGGQGTPFKNMKFGRTSGTTDGSGILLINHGVAVAPDVVLVTNDSFAGRMVSVAGRAASNFSVRVRDDSGALLNGVSQDVFWVAIYF